MKALNIEADDEITPDVILDREKNIFSIYGWSHPEDAISFYAPVINWLLAYSKVPNEKTQFHFNFQYFNTASAKQIFNICTILDEIAFKNPLTIYWHYDKEDEDMRTSGERFAAMLKAPFEYIENK